MFGQCVYELHDILVAVVCKFIFFTRNRWKIRIVAEN